MTIRRIGTPARASSAVVHHGIAYLAGQLVRDSGLDVAGQMTACLAAADAKLAEIGSDKTQIIFVEILLADISGYEDMNRAWDEWVDRDHAPARATYEARLASPDVLVELLVTAAVPGPPLS